MVQYSGLRRYGDDAAAEARLEAQVWLFTDGRLRFAYRQAPQPTPSEHKRKAGEAVCQREMVY